MAREQDSRQSYRCAIPPEDGAAKLKINGKLVDCTVLDTSRDSFGVSLPTAIGKKLVSGSPRLELRFRGERWQVAVSSHFQDTEQTLTIGLERVRDLTKIKQPSAWGSKAAPQFSTGTDPSFLLALMVAFLLCCLCLPGIGDSLGTAPRVREGVNSMMEYVSEAVH